MAEENKVIGWFTKDGKHIPIFENQPTVAENKKDREIKAYAEQADKLNGKKKIDEYKAVKGLTFGIAHITDDYIDIDGYSDKKSEKAMLNQLAKVVDKYNKGEADAIRDMVKFDEIQQYPARKDEPAAQYIIEWEDVPSASRMVDKDGVDTILSTRDDKDEEDGWSIESANGNYYVHIRFIR